MAKILIVEDSNLNRKLWVRCLQSNNHQVIEASNGKIGVDKFKHVSPDLVFMDINMPVMDGITALKEILFINPGALVVMVSAVGNKESVLGAITLGAKGFLVKPFKPERIIFEAEKYLEEFGMIKSKVKKILIIKYRFFSNFEAKPIFEDTPYFVQVVTETEKALAVAKMENPDLVITNGIEPILLLKEIRQTQQIPILFLALKHQKVKANSALKIGAKHYLLEPFSQERILHMVKTILDEKTDNPKEGIDDQTRFLLYRNPSSAIYVLEFFLMHISFPYSKDVFEEILLGNKENTDGVKRDGVLGVRLSMLFKKLGFNVEWSSAKSLKVLKKSTLLYLDDFHYVVFMEWVNDKLVKIFNSDLGILELPYQIIEEKWAYPFYLSHISKIRSV